MKKFILAAAIAAVAAAPVAASAADAERVVAPISGESDLGVGGPTITALVVLAALITAVVLVADDEDDEAVSP